MNRSHEELLGYVRTRLPGDSRRVDVALVERVLRDSGVIFATSPADVAAELHAAITGAGPLQLLLDDPLVTDVLVNGSAGVWVDGGSGLRPVDVDLGGTDAIRSLAVRLAAAGGRRLDDAEPTVDARLPDGTRLHAVLPPLAPDGPLISLRTSRARSFTVDELVAAGSLPACWARLLVGLMHARVSFLISGATGSGKSTILAALLGEVADDERIAIIEESSELMPRHPHVIRLQSRRPNVEGSGGVDLVDLVRETLRMRPDRIVVGECRGAELRELLGALNTGHAGAGTIHANTATDVPSRLLALGSLAGMDAAAVTTHTLSALRIVVHMDRSGSRRAVTQIAVLAQTSGQLVASRAASWLPGESGREPCHVGRGVCVHGVRADESWNELLGVIGSRRQP